MHSEVNMRKYVVNFGIVYTLGLILLGVIFTILELDANSGASVAVLIVAAMHTAAKFIQDNKRLPSKEEKSKLVWFSFFVSWFVSLVIFIVILYTSAGTQGFTEISHLIEQLGIFIFSIIIIFVSLLYIALLYFGYGGLAKKQFEALKKKGKV